MLRILVVDDEPNIAEGLCHLIQSTDAEGLDVNRAYSGSQALSMIGEAPVDLILSDIRMPGMTGLQLLSAVEEYWPSCRVVFLTGYDQFEYIHTAIKAPQCAGYLLKTEGDEAILATVKKEIEKIRLQKEHNTLLARAKEQLSAMQSLLRDQYLRCLVSEGPGAAERSGLGPDDLKLRVDPSKALFAAVCRSQQTTQAGFMERTRMAVVLDEAMSDAFGGHVARDFVLLDEGMSVWLMQPSAQSARSDQAAPPESFPGYIGAGLQMVQNSVHQIGSSVSFILASEAVSAEELPAKVRALQALALKLSASGSEMLVHERQAAEFLPADGGEQTALRMEFPIRLRRLEPLLLEGRPEEFTKEFHDLFAEPLGEKASADAFCRTTLLTMFLSAAGRLDISGEVIGRIRLPELQPAGETSASMDQFLILGQEISRIRSARMKSASDTSIDRIRSYILKNIADKNLCLSRIAANSFYNPTYLSRFFKQETGSNLSDYINEVRIKRALELIRNRDVRINEIASRIGFESSSYFTMFFKKRMGVTPNEYRASLQS